jgi:DNA-binding Lrp family transcriptional regulator
LDRLDLAILKILLANNGVPPGVRILRKSFRSMARDLAIDQSTVRTRVKRFQENGALKGWCLGVNPGNSGLHVGQVWLGVQEPDKAEVISSLLSSESVERVCSYFGPTLSFLFLFQGGSDPHPVLAKLLERAGPGVSLLSQGVIPVPSSPLKDLDASIVESLREDPWKPFQKVAKEVKASPKTVARRVAKMSERGSIYVLPVVDLKALQGVIPAELVVDYASSASRGPTTARIVSQVGKHLVFSDTKGPRGYFAVFTENLSELERLAELCRKDGGVKSIRVSGLQDVILNTMHYQSRQAR